MALASYALLTCVDALVKLLGAHYHVFQITLFNCGFALVAILTIAWLRGDVRRMKPRRWRLHLVRGGVTVATTVVNFWSYVHFPLVDVYAILFSSPLIATLLAAAVLKEHVSPRRWAAVAIGFCGVLIVLEPSGVAFRWASLIPLIGASGMAVNMILLRRLGLNGETVESTGTVGNVCALLIAPFVVPAVWVEPRGLDLMLVMASGLLTGCSFLLLASAFRAAPAASIAPLQYAQLFFATVAGVVLFSSVPAWHTVLGAAVILGSCLWSFREGAAPTL
ncbi:DMT family transporter [Acuticoccus mangrovi]|uniref:DMT family transporter n=1 Tax=Acuticoccus mangrovi TaxID=2796142 RepID=A0A934IHY2_9HYPH|nr:DMT family transporter [Acuticoccus mangrovi]MBJ3775321.1 DMT family transporter [Acuticoccus mangrovi]